MPTQYDGVPSHITIPAQIAISSSTNANPIVITTATSITGILNTGDRVNILNHQVNTTANGIRDVTVLSGNTFSIPVAGVGVGGATGTVSPLVFGASYQIPSDGDLVDASNNNTSVEALGDRTAFTLVQTGSYKLAGYTALGANDPLLAAGNWATITSLSTSWTAGSPNLLSLAGLIAGDIVEASLTFSANMSGSAWVTISLGFANFVPGAPTAAAKIPNCGQLLLPATTNIGMHLRGSLSVLTTGDVTLYVGHEATATGSTVTNLIGDHALAVQVWRPTGVNQ